MREFYTLTRPLARNPELATTLLTELETLPFPLARHFQLITP